MRGIRGDLLFLSVILSLAAHFGIMYYAKPRVMTHVVNGYTHVQKRGPMQVSDNPDIPEPVEIQTLKDIEPEKEAPEAEEVSAATPKLESNLPVEDGALAVPEVAMPEISTAEIPVEKLPEVMAANLSPVPAPEMKMMTNDLSTPTEPEQLLHLPSANPTEIPTGPAFGAPEIAALGEFSTIKAEETALDQIVMTEEKSAENATPEFVPVEEVLQKVDESLVEKEKEAVRALVDATDAADLASRVDVKLARAEGVDGIYFRVTISPRPELAVVSKDVVVLIDASGSIGKDRMRSIRTAAKTILRSASNTGDRFNLVAFRDRFSYAFKTWQECNVTSYAQADNWLNNVAPYGRTDVFATIRSVLTLPRDPTRPLIALVVTDGDANAGVRDTADILSKFSRLNDGLVSVYMYGVKSSANKELIDVLTRGNRGDSFIFDGLAWKAGSAIEPLSRHFRDPVLSDLRIIFASDCQATVYPRLLKNLYKGETVEFVGRVPQGTREVSFSLKGLNGKDAYESFFRLPLDSGAFEAGLDKAWAAGREIDLKLR